MRPKEVGKKIQEFYYVEHMCMVVLVQMYVCIPLFIQQRSRMQTIALEPHI